MIQRLPRRSRVELLRITGAAADHPVGMMTGMQHYSLDGIEVRHLLPQLERQVDKGLGLIFRRVLLGIGLQNHLLGLPGLG